MCPGTRAEQRDRGCAKQLGFFSSLFLECYWPSAAAPITGLSPGGGRVVKGNRLDGVFSRLVQHSANPRTSIIRSSKDQDGLCCPLGEHNRDRL